jgi:signal transduction histidine kinase
MKTIRRPATDADSEIIALRERLAHAEATLEAIRHGEIDALVVAGPQGEDIFTLKGAEKPYRLLIEAMNEGALTVIPDGTILYCNHRFAEMVASPIGEIIGGSLYHRVLTRQRRLLQKWLKNLPPAGGKAEFNLILGSVPESSLPAQFSFRPLQVDGAGAIAVVATDLSDRKKYEEGLRRRKEELAQRVAERTEELTRTNEALQEAQCRLRRDAQQLEQQVAERTAALQESVQSLEQFCYTIAHDLRAPLRTMHGFSSALLDDYGNQLDGAGRDYATRIIAAATRMDEQIRALLAYGRLNSAEMPLVRADPAALLAEILQSDQFKSAQIDLQSPLPRVLANPTAFKQIMDNLLANAVKFVAPGTIPHVQLSAVANGETVRFVVQDNGIGIEPKYHERIFKVFERIASKEFAGTGIGLAIVQKGVERMGGRVGVESAPGQGSRFWIELRKAD